MSSFVAELRRGEGPVRATGIANPGDGSWIVGHVRLDAREALRDALGAAGVPTQRDATDTGLVLAAWGAWRETAAERLAGDFSFALWDHRRRELFCARDPLGVRPFYWALVGDAFVCSNALGEIRAHRGISTRLHEPAIVSFLQSGFNADLSTTTFADIRRLPPAHQLLVPTDLRAAEPRRYWSFPVPEPLVLARDEEYVERFREVLGDAVRDRLRADRAAILLSGGLDSTCLAATARRVAPGVALSAWTYDVGESAPPDEVALAARAAERLGIVHDVARADGVALAHLQRPGFGTPEPLDEPDWGFWAGQLRRIAQRAPVLVIGEDGDALFRPPGLLTMLRSWPALDVLRRAMSYTIANRRHPHLGIWLGRRLRRPFLPDGRRTPEWIRRDVLARAGHVRSARAVRAVRAAPHPTRPDAVRYLSDPVWQSVLEPAQPAYTRVALEIAWPMLDARVIEFVFSIPPVPWCQRKTMLRTAFRGELPDEILDRPKSPLPHLLARQVANWRASESSEDVKFGDSVREFVDSRMVANTLKRGSVLEVTAAWRVLELDHWLRSVDRPSAFRSRNP